MSFQNTITEDGSININVIPSFGHIVNLAEREKSQYVKLAQSRLETSKLGGKRREPYIPNLKILTQLVMPHSASEKQSNSQSIANTSTSMLKDPDSAEDLVSDMFVSTRSLSIKDRIFDIILMSILLSSQDKSLIARKAHVQTNIGFDEDIPQGWERLRIQEGMTILEKLKSILTQWSIVAFQKGTLTGHGYGYDSSPRYGVQCGEGFIIKRRQ